MKSKLSLLVPLFMRNITATPLKSTASILLHIFLIVFSKKILQREKGGSL